MKKRFISNGLVIAGILTLVIWSCKDDFTEEDLLKQQAEISQQAQAHADSVAAAQQAHDDSLSQKRIDYTIIIYNASVTESSAGGRTTETTGLESATVSVTVNGQSMSQSTNADGMVVFEGVPEGSIAGTVSMSGFTTVHFVANLHLSGIISNDTKFSAGTVIPVFETSGENTSKISGTLTYEGNLLNDTEEMVPDGTVVAFSIDTENANFRQSYLQRQQGNDLGEINSIAFEGNFTTTTSGGNYSIELPGTPKGLIYTMSLSDFTADQMIAINNYENEQSGSVRDVVTVPTHFTQSTGEIFPNNATTQIPAINAVQIDIDAPPPSGSGAAMTAVLEATDAGTFTIVAEGSGYAPGAAIPMTVSDEFWDNTVTGAVEASIEGMTDAAGRITSINVIDPGHGYRGRPEVTVGGAGTGAVVVSNYFSTVAPLFGNPGDDTGASSGTVLTSGGSGYVVAPQVEFRGVTAPANIEEVTLLTAVAIINGSVVDVPTPVTLYRYAPTVTIKDILRIQARGFVGGNFGGSIISFSVSISGSGYDPTSPPSITFRDLRGNGSGAQGHVESSVFGTINAVIYGTTATGSNYSIGDANFPGTATPFSISTYLDNGNLITLKNTLSLKSGVTRIVNAYYGTGIRQRGVE